MSNEPKSLVFPQDEPEGPKPLVFPDNKGNVMSNGPKAISFGDEKPVSSSKSTPSPLSFDNVPPVAPKPTTHTPQAAFDDGSNDPLVKQAVQLAKRTFAQLYNSNKTLIQNQINQLVPIVDSVITSWGDSALAVQVELTAKVAKLVQDYSALKCDTVLTEVLQATVPQKKGLLDKIFNNSQQTTALQYKPTLIMIESQLANLLPFCQQTLAKAIETHDRLLVRIASLSSVNDVITGNNPTADIMFNRRQLLQQAATNMEFAVTQLKQLSIQINDMLPKIKQLLVVTLPALEMATAYKK